MADLSAPGVLHGERVVRRPQGDERRGRRQRPRARPSRGEAEARESEDAIERGERTVERAPRRDLHVRPARREDARAERELEEVGGVPGDAPARVAGREAVQWRERADEVARCVERDAAAEGGGEPREASPRSSSSRPQHRRHQSGRAREAEEGRSGR